MTATAHIKAAAGGRIASRNTRRITDIDFQHCVVIPCGLQTRTLAIDEALRQNCISGSYSALLVGFGAGLMWSSALLRWQVNAYR